jgi:hypothetical protein
MQTGSASSGGISDSSGSSQYPSIVMGYDRMPVVAWQDDTSGDLEIFTRKWSGTAWPETVTGSATVGGISANSGDSQNPVVAMDSDGVPYVAWSDNTAGGSFEIYARKYTGGWEAFSTTRNWSLTPGGGLKTVYAKFRDTADNKTTAYSGTIIFDDNPPDTSITSGPPNPTNSVNATFTFTSSKPSSTFDCRMDAGAFTPLRGPGGRNPYL